MQAPPITAYNSLFEVGSIAHVAQLRGAFQPDDIGYTFVDDAVENPVSLTYRELDQRARQVAAVLRQQLAPSDRVLLVFPAGLEFVCAFFGCLYAELVAVPVYPALSKTQLPRLAAIARDSGAKLALSCAASKPAAIAEFPELAALRWLDSAEIAQTEVERPDTNTLIADSSLAMLQYTSGSTGAPKGVMITHGSLLRNCALIQHWLKLDATQPGVTWLPPYHDMGLIGCILEPMFAGFHAVMLSPWTFARKPSTWLHAISRYRAAVSGAPNFAYELCARTVSEEEKRTLDLSAWTAAFCGAEAISAGTLARFADAFAACGFSREAFAPCYGLAEATLAVTGRVGSAATSGHAFDSAALAEGRAVSAANGASGSCLLVSCGKPLDGTSVVIVNAETHALEPEGVVGEVWVDSPSAALGYWEKTALSRETFGLELEARARRYLRTGDVGFIWGSELYIAGRSKDLIIIRGKKFSPVDVENVVEASHASIRPSSAIAFGFRREDEECLVVVARVSAADARAKSEEITVAIRAAVSKSMSLQVASVCLVTSDKIGRTSSGKARRFAWRAAFEKGAL
jgi:acyl-CoA synthetase (AMP-forming)/AMP-acid ligase II